MSKRVEQVAQRRQRVTEAIQGASASKVVHTGRMPASYFHLADAAIAAADATSPLLNIETYILDEFDQWCVEEYGATADQESQLGRLRSRLKIAARAEVKTHG